MNMTPTHSFNPAPILAGSTRIKSAGWPLLHPTTTKTMFEYTQKTVKGIVMSHARRLLESSRDVDRVDLADLLEYILIAGREGGAFGLQSLISDHVCGRYPHIVGECWCYRGSQDKVNYDLAGYLSAACSDLGVTA